MFFRNYGVRNTWLDNCRKSFVPEHRATVNMLKCPKHCLNLHGSTLIIYSPQSEGNRVGKCLS